MSSYLSVFWRASLREMPTQRSENNKHFSKVVKGLVHPKILILSLITQPHVRKLSNIIKNILICVLKMNEDLAGLERYEGE